MISKMADETVDCLVLVPNCAYVAPHLVSENCDISIITRRTNVFVFCTYAYIGRRSRLLKRRLCLMFSCLYPFSSDLSGNSLNLAPECFGNFPNLKDL